MVTADVGFDLPSIVFQILISLPFLHIFFTCEVIVFQALLTDGLNFWMLIEWLILDGRYVKSNIYSQVSKLNMEQILQSIESHTKASSNSTVCP